MYKARNVDGFLETTNHALFEVEGLILCAGDEGDGDTEVFRYDAGPARA